MAFNKITDTLNVHQSRANRPIEDASTLKALYDQDVNTVKTRVNEHIDELASTTSGSSGADNIGINAVGVVASNINDAVAEVQANVASAVAGDIPDNSLTELQMANEMKKQAGGVYPYNSGATNASNIATNTSNIQANTDAIAEIEEIRVATDTTGSLNAYVLDTGNNFDFTLDGNVVRLNPNFTCTGTSTIAVDGTTKAIRKFDIDTDAYVVIENEDIKKNNPTELRYDVSEGFFVLALKDGLSSADKANLIPTNIKEGITIKDVTGTFTGPIMNVGTIQMIYGPTERSLTTAVYTKIKACTIAYDGTIRVSYQWKYIKYSQNGNFGIYVNGTRVNNINVTATTSSYATQTFDTSVSAGDEVSIRVSCSVNGAGAMFVQEFEILTDLEISTLDQD